MENYAQNRLESIGFDPIKEFGLWDTYSGEVGGLKPKPRMWSDPEGNLCIGLVDLDNIFISQAPEASFKPASREIVHVMRLANPEPSGGKYRPSKIGQGVYPCYWPFTLKCFKSKSKVKTLVLTEGYLKAYQLDKADILAIGLPGITVWKEKKQQDIFQGIRDLVEACEVENIIWLTDGDTTKVSWEEGKDLSRRPWSFYTSVRIFKEKTLDLECNQFWYHLHETSLHKGIDDLILSDPDLIPNIKRDINRPGSTDGKHFKRFNVGAMTFEKIKEYFGIHDGVEGFYKKYEDIIGIRTFVYGRGVYQYNEEAKKLEYKRAGESEQFVMIDSTYYIKGPMENIFGTVEKVLKPTKGQSIKKMFQHKSKSDLLKILYDIQHFNGFINRPSHVAYKQVYETLDKDTGFSMKYYNKYNQLSHNPKPGNCPLSLNFIKHVFGTGTIEYKGKTYNEFDLGLDYIQLLYLKPTQKLPILCLVSEEGSTGKTKFWEWMAAIFQQNVREINSDMLTGQFTTYFASNLLCYIDEAFIDRAHTIEKLKQLVTSKTQRLEGKFENADTIDNFLKIGLSSNNVNNFANIRIEEMRFWIRELKPITEENYIKDFEEKLYAEIPSFLHFLQNRELATENETRLHFGSELIFTEALSVIKKESRSGVEIMLEMCIREYISLCGKSIVRLSPNDIKYLLNENSLTLAKIRWGLQRFKIEIDPYSSQYTFFEFPKTIDEEYKPVETTKKSATYSILATSFFAPEECIKIFDHDELLKLEKAEKRIHKETWFEQLKNRSLLLKNESSETIEILNKADSFKTFIELTTKPPF